MKLVVDNVHATVIQFSPAERSWLRDLLSLDVRGAIYSGLYRSGQWDGKKYFFDGKHFMTGLVPYVKQQAKKFEVPLDIEDVRSLPGLPLPLPNELPGITLREYQLSAAEYMLTKTRGILKSPTGSGKTEIGTLMLKSVPEECLSLILVHSREALNDWLTRCREYGFRDDELGVIWRKDSYIRRVTVANIQSLRKLAQNKDSRLLKFHFALVDECQLGGAESYQLTLRLMLNAYWRYGFSATPLDYADIRNLTLIGSLGPMRREIDIEPLMREGVLPILHVHVIRVPAPTVLISPLGTGTEKCRAYYDTYLHTNVAFAQRIRKIVEDNPSLQFLITINKIEHGTLLWKTLEGSTFIHGSTNDKVRDNLIASFKRGEIRTLIASPILDAGFNARDIGGLILAGGYESLVRLVQRIGRGLRKKSEEMKNELHIWEFIFEGIPYMEEHSFNRIEAIKNYYPKELTVFHEEKF